MPYISSVHSGQLLLSSSSHSSPDYNLHHHTFSLPIEKVVLKTMHSCNVQYPNKPPAVNLNEYEQAITNKTFSSTPNKFSFYFHSSGALGPNTQCGFHHQKWKNAERSPSPQEVTAAENNICDFHTVWDKILPGITRCQQNTPSL
jgi:hypothetical protein